MNVKELTSTVEGLQQQIDALRQLITDQASVIETLRTQRAQTRAVAAPKHLDREQRIAAVARLSARYPKARSFSPQQVEAEIADAEFAEVCAVVGDPE